MENRALDSEVDAGGDEFKPLSAEEALLWQARNPTVSVWRLLSAQALVGVLVALVAWALTGRPQVGWSAAYGALAVVVPAAMFAHGVFRPAGANPRAAMLRFAGWELAKILLTVALLIAAPRWIAGLSWLALLAGLVVTMKTYWVALLWRSGS